MPALASPEWVDAIDGALRAVARPEGATSRAVVEYRIVDADDSSACYHITADADGYRASTGPAPDPTARVTMARAVAAGLCRGDRDAHAEMLMGTISVTGDTVGLTDISADLAAIREAIASVPVDTGD